MPIRPSGSESGIHPERRAQAGVFFLLALVCLSAAACSFGQPNYLRRELLNLGPLALSPENPYVDPNRLLILERSESIVLDGFLAHRGNPDALELIQDSSNPLELRLYYFGKEEMYRLRQSPEEWLVRGPYPLPEQRVRILRSPKQVGKRPEKPTALTRRINAVRELDAEQEKEAALKGDKEKSTAQESTPQESALTQVEQTASTKRPEPFSPAKQEQEGKDTGTPAGAPMRTETTSVKEEPDALPSSARESDLLHTVTFPGETLRMISAWYTGTPENAERIARVNKLPDPDKLELKQIIRIPEYLAVRMEPFGRDAVRQYLRTRSLPLE